MEKELQTTLAEILVKASQATGQATDFVLAQAPDVIQQYIKLTIIWGIIGALGLGVCLVLFILMFNEARRQSATERQNRYGDPSSVWLLFSIASLLIIASPAVTSFNLVSRGVTAYVAPKVFILQEAVRLAK